MTSTLGARLVRSLSARLPTALLRQVGLLSSRYRALNETVRRGIEARAIDRPNWTAFAEAVRRVVGDPALGPDFRGGRASWFDRRFGLGDLALGAGFEALHANDAATASLLCAWLDGAEAMGPRAMRLRALTHATNEDWGLAAKFWKSGKGAEKDVSAETWERHERRFAEMRRILAALDVDWMDLRPILPAEQRMAMVDDFIRASLARSDVDRRRLAPLIAARDVGGDAAPTPMAAEVAATVRSISARGLRNFVDGRTVCLVANSNTVATSGLGRVIDAYDVVIRFNSFLIDPPNTGERTTVHVCIHLYEFNLDVPVEVRIMISGREELWRPSVMTKIRPGAQRWLGDDTLRWPAAQAGLITPKDPFRTPTAGFNMLRLLMDFGVCTKLDLIGFDFYGSGSYRLPDAMSVAHSPAHNSAAEQAWVMSRARRIDGPIISM